MSRLQRWWIAFGLMVVAVAASYVLLDRPIAVFAHEYLVPNKIFVRLTYIPEPFAAIAATILVVLGVTSLSGRPLARWQLVAVTWSVSVFSATAIKNQLKLVFGRTWPETWTRGNPSLIHDDRFGFNLFQAPKDGWYESFPSGHSAAICAAMTVLWICYPRWRAVYALLIAAVVVGVIGANYHFLSDIIAGGFLGTSIAIVAVRLAGLAQDRKARPASDAGWLGLGQNHARTPRLGGDAAPVVVGEPTSDSPAPRPAQPRMAAPADAGGEAVTPPARS
jgi:membrane-associated phospholipid phosphatase